jgi:hypothetical protein
VLDVGGVVEIDDLALVVIISCVVERSYLGKVPAKFCER